MNKTFFTLVCLTIAMAGPAHAASTNAVVRNTPSSMLNEADDALTKARADESLKAGNDGETLDWKNHKIGASDAVTPVNRVTWNGLRCRRLRIGNTHRGTTGRGVDERCEKRPGRWKPVGPDAGQK